MTTERAPKTTWCWLCRRALRLDDDEAVRVLVEGRDEWVCGRCVEQADVGPGVPLSYEEGDDDASR